MGFSYHKNSKNGGTIYYRCSRSITDHCEERLIIKNNNIITKGNHSCKKIITQEAEIPDLNISPNDFLNKFINEKANKVDLYPNAIYQDLLIALRDKFKEYPYSIPSKNRIFSKIRAIRKTQDLSSIQGVTSQLACYKDNGQPFFRRLWTGDIHNEYHTVMIWATNETLGLLKYNSHVFMDATLRSTPKGFSQCLVIMTFDLGTQTFVPCAYALMTGKLEYLYSVVLHEMIFLLEFKWMPKYITTDFEKGLIKTIIYEFPQSTIIGCYFHFKQAIRRRLINYNVLPQNIETILANCELLTLINQEDIGTGIEYIKNQTVADAHIDKFWAYFQTTWIKNYGPTLCNIKDVFNDNNFAGRTNNSVERYHRRLTENFANAHANLAAFVEIIRKEFKYYEERMTEIRQNGSGIQYEHPQHERNPLLEKFQRFKDQRENS